MILDLIEYQTSKPPPFFVEAPVPEATAPYLVGNPRAEEKEPLCWADGSRNKILTWGVTCSVEEIISSMKKLILIRSRIFNWGVEQEEISKAKNRMEKLDLIPIQVNGDLVTPQSPDLLGSVLIIGGKKYPVIHNPARGVCILKG